MTRALESWEYAEYVCTALVAIACFGEYIAEFTEWWRRNGLWKWFGLLSNRRDRVAKVSTLALIVALAGELLCVVITNQLSGKLVGALGDRAEEAFSKSGNAKTLASDADILAKSARHEVDSFAKDIASVKHDALEAKALLSEVQKRAADETLARVKLESLVIWKVPSEDVEVKAARKIVPFARQKYALIFNPSDSESLGEVSWISRLLSDGKWNREETPSRTELNLPAVNVVIWITPHAPELVVKAATVLVDALAPAELRPTLLRWPWGGPPGLTPDDVIRVVLFRRGPPSLLKFAGP